MRIVHPPCIEFPHIPEKIRGLADLAANLWWSWHPAARMVFKSLDRQAWKESGHNPVKMLRDLPPEVLETAAQDVHYLRHYNLVLSRFQKEVVAGSWRNICNGVELKSHPIAYFSAEYGLHHSFPFYAGGQGVPREWVRIMKESIKSCAHRFSARRMIKDYIYRLYAGAVKEF